MTRTLHSIITQSGSLINYRYVEEICRNKNSIVLGIVDGYSNATALAATYTTEEDAEKCMAFIIAAIGAGAIECLDFRYDVTRDLL